MTHIGNPTGKGGFAERPQDINVGGRTKKYLTLLLEQIGTEIEPKSGKQFKELIARRTWIDALNGDQRAIEFIFDRIEGKPEQPLKHSGEISFPTPIYGAKSTEST